MVVLLTHNPVLFIIKNYKIYKFYSSCDDIPISHPLSRNKLRKFLLYIKEGEIIPLNLQFLDFLYKRNNKMLKTNKCVRGDQQTFSLIRWIPVKHAHNAVHLQIPELEGGWIFTMTSLVGGFLLVEGT